MTPTAFGVQCLKDPNFVFDLQKGRKPNIETLDQVEQFISSNTPEPEAAS